MKLFDWLNRQDANDPQNGSWKWLAIVLVIVQSRPFFYVRTSIRWDHPYLVFVGLGILNTGIFIAYYLGDMLARRMVVFALFLICATCNMWCWWQPDGDVSCLGWILVPYTLLSGIYLVSCRWRRP